MTSNSVNVSVSPGSILKKELEERGWSQTDLAEIMGRPIQAINEILKGKKAITAATARGLENALEVPAEFWLNLESQFQLSQEAKKDRDVARRSRLFSRAPVAAIRRRNWIDDTRDIEILEKQIMQLLRIKTLESEPVTQFAARKSSDYGEISPEQEAWCSRARQLAESMQVNRFYPNKFRNGLADLRLLAKNLDGIARVPDLLASLGIRFVIVEHLPKSKIDGATFWLSKARPVVALSLRYGRIDYFWFTLFHELSHVSHNDSMSIDSDLIQNSECATVIEKRANEEAANILVPENLRRTFISQNRSSVSKRAIIQFAKKINIHPGIILGQLQHRGIVSWSTGRELLVSIRDSICEVSITDGWGR